MKNATHLILALALGLSAGTPDLAASPLPQRPKTSVRYEYAHHGDPAQMMDQAAACRARRQYRQAFEIYMDLTDSKDTYYASLAWNSLGYMYREGQVDGVPTPWGSWEECKEYCYRQSATCTRPCKEGCLNYARILRAYEAYNADTESIRFYYQRAARLGSDDAVRELRTLRQKPLGYPVSVGGDPQQMMERALSLRSSGRYKEAYDIYLLLTDCDDTQPYASLAWNSLGYMYREGMLNNGPFINGLKRHECQALCYRCSAICRKPCKEGCLNHARSLRDGLDARPDYEAARFYYQRAARLGSDDAVRELRTLP